MLMLKVTLQVCEGVCLNRPPQLDSTEPWQKPETQSNLGEHLSLFDEIHPVEFSEERERKARAWKYAHSKSMMTLIF